jgi:hypothetical protein
MSRVSVALRSLRASAGGRRWRAASRLALVATALVPLANCTAAQTAGQSSSYLIVQSIEGANGATPDKLAGTFSSDVFTYVKRQVNGQQVLIPTIFEDPGAVTFRLGMKNPSLTPTATNFITVTRYHVQYVRADGRNTPGVDVPYPFDGAMTMTVTDDVVVGSLTLVRIQAKQENPLQPLINGGGAVAISAIAEVTFFGTDQAGREVSAVGRISVTFSDWGDPG